MSATPPRQRDYVLGVDEIERRRLGFQHRLWSAEALAIWRDAGFAPGQRILDIGCGPGFAAIDMAELLGPATRITGVDAAAPYLESLRTDAAARGVGAQIETLQQDVQELDLPENAFDNAYARWVFCFLERPEAVVEAVQRTLKPGGALAIQDYYNYLAVAVFPRHPAIDRIFQATDASWRERGGDPDIGARLPGMLRAAGFDVRLVRPLVRTGTPRDTIWRWPTTFFRESFLPRLVEGGHISEEERTAFERAWDERTSEPDTTLLTTPAMLDIVAVKQ
jgi:SAM-dependent methyltransferase